MWGVIETEDGTERHVVPMVKIDGEEFPSAGHTLSRYCICRPKNIQDVEPAFGEFTGPIWNHHDPDHEGAQSDEEFASGKLRNPEPVQ